MIPSHTQPRHIILRLGVAAALGACGAGRDQIDGSATRRDSAGVEIVENHSSAWSAARPWRVGANPILSIGNEDGDSSQLVWKVLGAAKLSDGKIAILSGSSRRIVVFDRRPRFVRTIGRPGPGPGEFSQPQHLQYRAGDTLIVWDDHFGPVTSFDAAGNLLQRRQFDLAAVMDAVSKGGFSEHLTPLSDGSFVAHVHLRAPGNPPVGEVFREPMAYLRVRADYSSDSLGTYGGPEQMFMKLADRPFPAFPVFSTRSTVAAGGSPPRIFISNGDDFEVREFAETGKLSRIIRRTTPPIPIPQSETDAQIKWLIEVNARNSQGRSQLEQMFRAVPKKSHYPAVMDIFVDREDCLWVKERPQHWSVFDPSGTWLGTLQIPVTDVLDIGDNFILGVVRDELTVEKVVEYRLVR